MSFLITMAARITAVRIIRQFLTKVVGLFCPEPGVLAPWKKLNKLTPKLPTLIKKGKGGLKENLECAGFLAQRNKG